MSSSAQFLNPSAAAQRLGVSAKALRLYEQHGLIAPGRTAAGWRAYGPDEMARAAEIVALRALGLSLSQIARVLGNDPQGLEPALAAHQATLESRIRQLAGTIEQVRDVRAGLAQGRLPTAGRTGSPVAPDRRVQRRLRSAVALGRRTLRTQRHQPVELYHRSAGQRQDAAGEALWQKPCLTRSSWVSIVWSKAAWQRGRGWTPTRRFKPGSVGPWPGWSKTVPRPRTPSITLLVGLETEGAGHRGCRHGGTGTGAINATGLDRAFAPTRS